MSEAQKDPGYYEARGMIRQMIVLTKDHAADLKAKAKGQGLTAGELVEVLLDTADLDALADAVAQKKADKKPDGRVAKSELSRKMKEATPEQLAEIQRILNS